MKSMAGRNVEFEVRWFPFQLDSKAPVQGVNKLEMYKAKFGESRVAQMLPMMTQTFADLGLSYSLGGLTGNTLDSHRLIHRAGEVGGAQMQDQLVEELFLNYFTQEKFINDRAVLVAAAEKVGLAGAAEYLADPQNGRSEVLSLISSKARQINGVPNFTINNRYSLSGAQDPSTFTQVFSQVLEEEGAAATAKGGSGAACAANGQGQCA